MTAKFSTLLNGLWLISIYRGGVVVETMTAKTWQAAEYKAQLALHNGGLK